jgi:hypothetical protein
VSRLSGYLAAAVLLASAVGGWYLLTDRSANGVDSGGFDVSATYKPRAAAPVSAAPEPAAPPSSLSWLRGGADRLNAATPPAPEKDRAPAAAPPGASSKESAREAFIAQARRYEHDVCRYAERLTAQSPVIRQYGKDWMRYPDLRKLNDDYNRDHDPIAFLVGLSKAPNFGAMVKKYAGSAEIRDAVVQGVTKEVPSDLVDAGMIVLATDPGMREMVSGVAGKMGLPETLAAAAGIGAKTPAGAPQPAPAR